MIDLVISKLNYAFFGLPVSGRNMAEGWSKEHYAVALIDATIEELIELRRCLPWRKHWAKPKPEVLKALYTKGTSERAEMVSEISDVYIFLAEVCHALEVDDTELKKAIESKIQYNKTRNDHET